MLKINNDTKLFGVLGENIPYTLSPAIHNYAFQRLGINAVYLRFDVRRDKFHSIIIGLLNIASGLNVTIPYKEDVVKYLYGVSEEARVIGAVNTIHNLNGYNTDYIAIYNLIKEKLIDKPSICTVFGAGGAGRASIYALLKLGCEVYVINRSLERAQSLEKDFKEFGYDIKIISSCKPGDIIVNATPNSSYVPDECIKGKLVVDLVYNPVKTPLILKAEKTGIRSINGLEILVRQAMEAERIWFGKSLSDEEVVKFLYARKLVR